LLFFNDIYPCLNVGYLALIGYTPPLIFDFPTSDPKISENFAMERFSRPIK